MKIFFSQNMISEVGIAVATTIFGLALNTFWKRVLRLFSIALVKHYCTHCDLPDDANHPSNNEQTRMRQLFVIMLKTKSNTHSIKVTRPLI